MLELLKKQKITALYLGCFKVLHQILQKIVKLKLDQGFPNWAVLKKVRGTLAAAWSLAIILKLH